MSTRRETAAAYVDAYVGALRDGMDAPRPQGSRYDCLYCLHRLPAGAPSEHVWEHVAKMEFPPSIAWIALKAAGEPMPHVLLGFHPNDEGLTVMGGSKLHNAQRVRAALLGYLLNPQPCSS